MKSYVLRLPKPESSFGRRFAGELNPQQLEVVTAPDGALLVLAGAGSGKTRAVTYRVAWLLDRGVPPEEIVLLTFTNKAAREMIRRVEALMSLDSRRLWSGTFHRIANLILRRHGNRLGYDENFSILDREDAREMIEAAIVDLGHDPRERRFPRGEVLAAAFSYTANVQADLPAVLLDKWPSFAELAPEIGEVARRYRARKRERNAMDYDDLLLNLLELLRDDALVREHYAQRFRHVLVDEYQDSNRIQAQIVAHLASLHRGVMAVGDDAQSIYSFRGADTANVLDFSSRWPEARILKLEINYRSTPEILELANASIRNNPAQHEKTLRAVKRPGGLPALVALRDAAQQSAFVAGRVLELRDEGTALPEIAVLYRSHWHSLEIQMELTRRRIPFEVRSGIRFFETAHVKDVLAFLRVATNPRDEMSWRRLLKLLPKVGNRTADKLFSVLAADADPLAAVARGALDPLLPRGAAMAWPAFRTLLGELADPSLLRRPADMIRRVLSGPYGVHAYQHFEDAESRLEDLDQLALFALSFADAQSFLSDLALSSQLEAEGDAPGLAGDSEGKIVLSTVHQAKGLEWHSVFVVWLADGRFPSARSLAEAAGEEEERRLFYVAVTRTRDDLYLCHPQLGRDEYRQDTLLKPSRFLLELPESSYERWQVNEEPIEQAPQPRSRRDRVGEPELFDDGPFPDEDGGI